MKITSIVKTNKRQKMLPAFFVTLTFVLTSIFPSFNFAEAALNKEINYQGKLTTSNSIAVANGTYNMEFKLYTSGGTTLWTETRTGGDRVPVSSGLFSVMLGELSSLSAVDFNQTLYLGVNIGGISSTPTWDGEMTPRKKLGVVPASIESERAATATKSTNLIGGNSTNLLGSVPYQSDTDTTSFVSPNVTLTKKFFSMTGTGTNGAVPLWEALVAGDVGLGNVTNESKTTMFTSPTFTGTVAGFTLGGNVVLGANTLTTSNTGLVLNLNADLLDGQEGSYYQPLLTNPVTGTGTDGYLPNWSTTGSALENSPIFTDGTNVGIGTTTPQEKLAVNGNVLITEGNKLGFRYTAADPGPYSYMTGGGAGPIGFYNVYGSTPSLKAFTFNSYPSGVATETVTILNSGNVGIGTTTPNVSLEVAGTGIAVGNTTDGIKLRLTGTVGEILGLSTSSGSWNDLDIRAQAGTQLYLKTDGNVGIGTTTPLSPLNVHQASGGASAVLTLSTGFGNTFGISPYINYVSNGGFEIKDLTNNVSRLVIQESTGNVGIGTTAPNTALEVYKTTDSRLRVRTSAYSSDIGQNGGDGVFTYGTYVDTNIINNHATSDGAYGNINFITGNASSSSVVMTIGGGTQKGNIGIGTTNPGTKFEIREPTRTISGNVSGDTQANLALIASDAMAANIGGTIGFGGQYLTPANNDILYAAIAGRKENANSGSADGYLSFNTWNGASGLNEKMRINSIGDVGIGTTSPNQKLSVNGNIEIKGNPGSTRYIITDESDTGTTQLIMQAGAGSAAYGGALNLFGNAHTSKPGWVTVGLSAVSGAKFTVNESGLAGGNDIFTVLRTGNVGIGTTNPSQILNVENNQNSTTRVLVGNTNTGSSARVGFLATGSGGNVGLETFGDNYTAPYGGNSMMYTSGASNKLFLGTVGTQRMVIDTSGNVGIGTTGPGAKLDILGTQGVINTTLNQKGVLSIQDNSAMAQDNGAVITLGGKYITSNSFSNYGAIKGGKTRVTDGFADGYLSFYTAAPTGVLSEKMRIDSTGNVGIGTTDPGNSKLKIAAGANYGLSISSAQRYMVELNNSNDATGGFWLGTENGGDFFIHENSVGDRFTLQNTTGNVGINDSSPGARLEVKGNAFFDDTNTYTGGYAWAGGTVQTNSIEILDQQNGSVVDGLYPTLTFHDYGNGGAQFSMEGATTTLHLGSGQSGSAGALSGAGSYFSKLKVWGGVETTSNLSIGGNLGVGTTTPINKLEITTESNVDNLLGLTVASGAYGMVFGLDPGTGNGTISGRAAGVNYLGVSVGRSTGNIGIGTTSPITKAHIYGTLTVDPRGISNSYSEGIRIANATNGYSNIMFGADPAAASGVTTNQWWVGKDGRDNGFNIYNNPAGDVLHILTSGNVGIGTISPGNILTIQQTSATDPIADAWTTYSSGRWKENRVPIVNALEKISELNPVYFDWTADHGGAHDLGFIAEEVGLIIPEVVAWEDNGIDAKSIDYARLSTVAIAGIKEMSLNIGAITGTIIPTPGSQEEVFANNFFENIFAKVGSWLGDIDNGLEKIFVKEIRTKKLCVLDEEGIETCVIKSQLDALLASAGESGADTGGGDLDSDAEIEFNPKAPVVTLNGEAVINLIKGDTYEEQGAVVTDDIDVDLVVVISGEVDTSTVGSYTLSYIATDTEGYMSISVTRTVNIEEFTAPASASTPSTPEAEADTPPSSAFDSTSASSTTTSTVSGSTTDTSTSSGSTTAGDSAPAPSSGDTATTGV